MADLGPTNPADTYPLLLQIEGGLSTTLSRLQDGLGNNTGVYFSTLSTRFDCGMSFGMESTTGGPPFSVNLTADSKMYHWVNPAGGTATVNLPDPLTVEPNRYFRVKNSGGSGSVVVKDDGGSTLATLTAGQNAEFIINNTGPAWEKV